MPQLTQHQGGCHCRKVRYETFVDLKNVIACNCSICQKHGLLLSFTSLDNFKLLSGGESLSEYRFGKKIIAHQICTSCGTESFAQGTNPDGSKMVAVNIRCLDDVDLNQVTPTPYDGKSL